MRNVLHDGGDVEDGISLEHAQLEVIEEEEFHWSLQVVARCLRSVDGLEDAVAGAARQAVLDRRDGTVKDAWA